MAGVARAEYLRKMAIHVVNPDGARWLNTAIEDATDVPGMRALSLAISLGAEHSRLSFESLIALAALLLMPVLHSSRELDEALPDAKVLMHMFHVWTAGAPFAMWSICCNIQV